jgi:quercetin dioxygenase-like cupin family protein
LRAGRATLSLREYRSGFTTDAPEMISYDVARGEAHFGPVDLALAGHVLTWELAAADVAVPDALLSHSVVLESESGWIARCDRIDFPPGGIAYTHTHPGPGIRYLLEGSITIRSEGRTTGYGAGDSWFEAGPEPVHATADLERPSAFVRVLLLPAE